ncbi:hypothetical protein C5S39_07900, partial [Candidatus Methanophagaceae archaeon]
FGDTEKTEKYLYTILVFKNIAKRIKR